MPIEKKLTWIENSNTDQTENDDQDEMDDTEISAILNEYPDEPEDEITEPKEEIPESEPTIKLSPLNKCLELTRNGLTIIAGSTETGKTTLVHHLLKHNVK